MPSRLVAALFRHREMKRTRSIPEMEDVVCRDLEVGEFTHTRWGKAIRVSKVKKEESEEERVPPTPRPVPVSLAIPSGPVTHSELTGQEEWIDRVVD